MKKLLTSVAGATALLGAFSAPAFASSTFHLVVPLSRAASPAPADPITVSLAGAALPKATVHTAYSHSLQDYLAVTGDKALDKSAARWILAEGSLPAGLALDATTGAVAGTPTAKTTSPASFTVLSSYKGSDGQAVYTIEVGGATVTLSAIGIGASHACGLTAQGGVKCWGANNVGQLGTGYSTDSLTPVDVFGLTSGVSSLAVGYGHTCVVTQEGAAKCWGSNSFGKVGDGSTANKSKPVQVSGLTSGVSSIYPSEDYTCALLQDSRVKCWGHNSSGQLGNNSTIGSTTPVSVQGLSNVQSIDAGVYHACAVITGGTLKCWGLNNKGQLGNLTTANSTVPVTAHGLTGKVTYVAAGQLHTCAVIEGGAVSCWGDNAYGQLGNGSTVNSLNPVAATIPGTQALSAYNLSTCAITNEGGAYCWGYNNKGQLGNGSTATRLSPTQVSGLSTGVVGLATMALSTCAELASGSMKCWGANTYGQLGDGSKTDRLSPVDVRSWQ